MRLIDADVLFENVGKIKPRNEEHYKSIGEFMTLITNAPTINAKWILCSERLPEEDGHYIVYAPSYRGGSSSGKEIHNGVMFSRFKNGKWSIEVGYHKRPNCVKAWMPLPKPLKGADNEM